MYNILILLVCTSGEIFIYRIQQMQSFLQRQHCFTNLTVSPMVNDKNTKNSYLQTGSNHLDQREKIQTNTVKL